MCALLYEDLQFEVENNDGSSDWSLMVYPLSYFSR